MQTVVATLLLVVSAVILTCVVIDYAIVTSRTNTPNH